MSGDLHIEDGEGDGDADFSVNYIVEEAVTGVVILFLVAAEAFFVEEDVVEGLDGGHDGVVGGVGADALAEVFDYLEVVGDIKVRVLGMGDEEGGTREVDVPVGRGHESGEGGVGLGVLHGCCG